jgi:hypothetical protein
MTKTEILNLKKNRLQKLEGSPKNIKCQGTVKKLRREIKNIETEA